MNPLLMGALYIILAPLAGALLAGIDRIITARMQNRVGPPLLQPLYDVSKLFRKAEVNVNRLQVPFMVTHLLFMIFTGALFFSGGDLLLVIFSLTVAGLFLVLAAYSTHSPFGFIGAERELIVLMACEPMLLIALAGLYKITGSLRFYDIVANHKPLIVFLPGIFLGLIYVLTLKLRKSPFDISTSHHAHQELVKGVTTDLSGTTLALVEIGHWYETVFLLGLLYLFFAFSPALGFAVLGLTYFLEILVDNTSARVRWQMAFTSTWLFTLIAGGSNLFLLFLLRT